MLFTADFFLGPNKFPIPIAINATSVAKTIINAIATYSSMLSPQNAHLRGYLCLLAHVAQYIIRDFNRLEKVPLFTKVALILKQKKERCTFQSTSLIIYPK